MIDIRISYEGTYIDNVYKTVAGYFRLDKSLLEELRPGQYPEAEHGEIVVEYPINHPEYDMATVMISPTKDGSDYSWTDINLPREQIEEMITIAEIRSRL